MPRTYRIGILSDIHYAGAAEQARGRNYEFHGLTNPWTRIPFKAYRRLVWLKNPFAHSHLVDAFLDQVGSVDAVIANGDYSCDSAFVGVSDDAAALSAAECLGKLRARFGSKFRATIGDHELGKFTLVGKRGGMRLTSWRRTTGELGLQPFWRVEFGNYVLMGLTSSLVAMPGFEFEALPSERAEWQRLRAEHLEEIRREFAALKPHQRVLLFCNDPTALPFLWREMPVREHGSLGDRDVLQGLAEIDFAG